MLIHNGNAINTRTRYEELVKSAETYKRFTPTFQSGNRIRHFSCSCLSPNNLCTDYENRPTPCRNYPVSSFMQFDSIKEGCGYKILPKRENFKILNRRLRHLIIRFELLNKIPSGSPSAEFSRILSQEELSQGLRP